MLLGGILVLETSGWGSNPQSLTMEREKKDWVKLIKEAMRLRFEIQKAESPEEKELARKAFFDYLIENDICEGGGMSEEDF